MIQGSIVALVTPMHADGRLDFDCLRKLVDFHVTQGTDALVAVGTTGESPTLNDDEHIEVIARTVEYAAGRIPVLGGTGSNCTAEAIALSSAAQQVGVDGCLQVTPYYNKPTQEGLYQHFRAIAEAVPIPHILYNVPGRTACDLLPETVARLTEIDNITGIKEATGDLGRLARLRELCPEDFALYTGDDATSCEFCLQGGHGSVTVTGNVAPRQVHDMLLAAIAGDKASALSKDAELAALHKQLFIQANPIPVKWALAELGLMGTGIRLPLTWLTEDCHEPVRAALKQSKLL
ncbi:MAG: 4-hydroxy-tetrahydrodipicolinate synthase [Methylococcales bacterium]|nr:4-hydroxy-tetrahydrodipicolinate synthase [Methylococcales bacterium]